MTNNSGVIRLRRGERGLVHGAKASEYLAVLKRPVLLIVKQGHDECIRQLGLEDRRENNNPKLTEFILKCGFSKTDTYYNWILRESKWLALDQADRILCGIGQLNAFNDGRVVIYKLTVNAAIPLHGQW